MTNLGTLRSHAHYEMLNGNVPMKRYARKALRRFETTIDPFEDDFGAADLPLLPVEVEIAHLAYWQEIEDDLTSDLDSYSDLGDEIEFMGTEYPDDEIDLAESLGIVAYGTSLDFEGWRGFSIVTP